MAHWSITIYAVASVALSGSTQSQPNVPGASPRYAIVVNFRSRSCWRPLRLCVESSSSNPRMVVCFPLDQNRYLTSILASAFTSNDDKGSFSVLHIWCVLVRGVHVVKAHPPMKNHVWDITYETLFKPTPGQLVFFSCSRLSVLSSQPRQQQIPS